MSSEIHLQNILDKINGTVTLAFSHQIEDVVVLDLLLRCRIKSLEVFTLDTHKLFAETLSYHEELEKFFKITIKKYQPDNNEIAKLEKQLGEFGMRESLESRHHCCQIRKVEPLQRALKGKSAWITGLRASQAITRVDIKVLEYDEKHNLFKINPLASWSEDDVNNYINKQNLPIHPLYAKNFKSIGCSPCTRAVSKNEDIRAGRWWWENPEHKECGLHIKEG